ncbi:MAG: M50 family metallopeptidase [Chloroflexi bacterium]|nr:M50 family metallopeptidase [Chloroflexota bacterium]
MREKVALPVDTATSKPARIERPLQRESVRIGMILLIATVVSVFLWLFPGAGIVLLPLRPFVALVHETWHAGMAILTGGHVKAIAIQGFSGNGDTLTVGGNPLLIASAGYVGSALTGAVFLAALRRPVAVRVLSVVVFLALAAATVLWNHTIFAWLYLLAVGLGLYGLVRLASNWVFALIVGFFALQLNLQVLADLRDLVLLSVGRTPTDAALAGQLTHTAPLLWALLWTAISLVFLGIGLRVAFGGSRRTSAAVG